MKNNGIDSSKYNSDRVYKLLKKYKVTYKNVTKDTILELIISTDKNQKGKIFGISEDNKILNNTANLIKTGMPPMPNMPYNIENTNTQNISDIQSRNSSSNKKLNNKIFFNKKARPKKVKNTDENDINSNNINIIHNNKKMFQSSIVPNFKTNLLDNMNMNMSNNIVNINNINIIPNQANILINGIPNIQYKRKTKNVQIIQGEKMEYNNENNVNEINQMETGLKNNINRKSVDFKGINKLKKIKNKIKKNDVSLDNKKVLQKKRKRRKKRKVTISLSTPENKKTQINRIMPGRKYIYGLGNKIQIQQKKTNTSSKKNKKLNPEDFNPLINEVEIVRDGLEIHNKTNIFPSRTLGQPFIDKNIMVGQPTPMDRFLEPMRSPIGAMGPYVYNVDMGYENNFMRKNINIPYTPNGFMSGIGTGIILPNTPNTPKREISMTNKIVIQNNNITGNENVEENNDVNKIKKPAPLNMDFIENENNDIGGGYPPFFGVGDNIGPLGTKQSVNSPANIFRLSPTSPFIPRFGDKRP